MKTTDKRWYKPTEIEKLGLLVGINGPANYRFILRLINGGKLKAKAWTTQGSGGEYGIRNHYLVSIDEIERYNHEFNAD